MWREVKRLRAKGWSISRIARVCGVSRNTVYRLLKLQEPPQFAGPRVKMTAYQEHVMERFAQMLIDQAYLKLNSEKRVQF